MSEIPDGEPLIFGRDFGWGKVSNKWVIRKTSRGWIARPPIASSFYGRKLGAHEFDTLLGEVVLIIDHDQAALKRDRRQEEIDDHHRMARYRRESAHLRKARA